VDSRSVPLLEFAFDRRASLADRGRVGLERSVAEIDREPTLVGCRPEFDDRGDAIERLADGRDRFGLDQRAARLFVEQRASGIRRRDRHLEARVVAHHSASATARPPWLTS